MYEHRDTQEAKHKPYQQKQLGGTIALEVKFTVNRRLSRFCSSEELAVGAEESTAQMHNRLRSIKQNFQLCLSF